MFNQPEVKNSREQERYRYETIQEMPSRLGIFLKLMLALTFCR